MVSISRKIFFNVEPRAHGNAHEFAVPAAGAEKCRERLENYAWSVEVGGR